MGIIFEFTMRRTHIGKIFCKSDYRHLHQSGQIWVENDNRTAHNDRKVAIQHNQP